LANAKIIGLKLETYFDTVPYAVFTDEELSELAKLNPLTAVGMKQIKGIGEKKVEKYGHHFSAI